MKNFGYLKIVLLLFIVALLAACGPQAAPEPAAPAQEEAAPAQEQAAPAEEEAAPAKTEDKPSMALVLIGPKDDNSWAEAAYNALQAQADKGVQTAFSESVSDADVARVMREYIDQGYDIII